MMRHQPQSQPQHPIHGPMPVTQFGPSPNLNFPPKQTLQPPPHFRPRFVRYRTFAERLGPKNAKSIVLVSQ